MLNRRLSLIPLLTLALVSCSQNVADPVEPEPMVFSAVASHSTKSIITTTNYPLDEPFAVEAVYYPKGKKQSDGDSFMTHEQVAYDFESGTWKTASEYYWPLTGTLHFYAGSPIIPNVSICPEYGVEADWSVPTNEDTQTDLCFSEVTEDCATHSNAVPVVFSHALSQICFKARTLKQYSYSQTENNLIQSNVFTVVLDSLKIRGIVSKGHFTQKGLSWTNDTSATAEYLVFKSDEGLELKCDRYENPILTKLNTMLLIPQEILEEAEVEEWHHVNVRTSITDSDTDEIISDVSYSLPRTSVIPLAKHCKRWLMDYKYTFRLAVGLTDTELTAAVTDWTETKEIILGDE